VTLPRVQDWTDPTWLAGIVAWAGDRIAAQGYSIVGPVEQPHVRPWSTVLRIPTDRGTVWCKAAGPGTAHEARLLVTFAAWEVPHVLLPLDADPDRGWLLFEEGGPTLRQTRPDGEGDRDLGAWERILAAYARLQRDVEGRAGDLLRAGVPDGRPAELPATFQRLVEDDVWWTLVTDEDRPAAEAGRRRLRDLGEWVAATAGELERSGIAATIQHDDLHGGNVFVGPTGIRVFDWGDAVVAHPFGSMVTTLNSVAYRLGSDPDGLELARLRDAYLDAWTDVLPRPALAEVLERALDLGRVGKAAAWARALHDVDPAAMDGHGDAPAMWLVDLVERLDRRGGS
jgi:Phosphotransferase enzyme family